METETSAPGERPKFLGCREQRVTGVLVFLLVGLSVFMTTILKKIPMAVLYGVFLYMGVSSLNGVQLMQRFSIVFMPAKYQPDYIFLRHVPVRRVHMFTAIQVTCLAILWVIKTIKKISIVFPLMVLAMCFVRKALDWVFTRNELKWLDDIMPESHKREKEEKKQKELEELEKEQQVISSSEFISDPNKPGNVIEMTGGAVNIPLKDGKSINIPVDRITYDPQTKEVNISEEMGRTAIWKQLALNESSPNIKAVKAKTDRDSSKNRKQRKHEDAEGKSDKPKFVIAEEEEEEEEHLQSPAILIDPPSTGSKGTSPDKESPLNTDSKV